MINKPSVLDEASMRLEFRRLFREIGMHGCLQTLYEMIACAEILVAVMGEEAEEAQKKGEKPT